MGKKRISSSEIESYGGDTTNLTDLFKRGMALFDSAVLPVPLLMGKYAAQMKCLFHGQSHYQKTHT